MCVTCAVFKLCMPKQRNKSALKWIYLHVWTITKLWRQWKRYNLFIKHYSYIRITKTGINNSLGNLHHCNTLNTSSNTKIYISNFWNRPDTPESKLDGVRMAKVELKSCVIFLECRKKKKSKSCTDLYAISVVLFPVYYIQLDAFNKLFQEA